MSTKNYDHLIGRTVSYRRLYERERSGVIAKVTTVYSIAGTGHVVTLTDGETVCLNLCYFSEPIC